MMTRGWGSGTTAAVQPSLSKLDGQGPGYQAPRSAATVVGQVRRNKEACRAQAEGSHHTPKAERQPKRPGAGGRPGQESDGHLLIALPPE